MRHFATCRLSSSSLTARSATLSGHIATSAGCKWRYIIVISSLTPPPSSTQTPTLSAPTSTPVQPLPTPVPNPARLFQLPSQPSPLNLSLLSHLILPSTPTLIPHIPSQYFPSYSPHPYPPPFLSPCTYPSSRPPPLLVLLCPPPISIRQREHFGQNIPSANQGDVSIMSWQFPIDRGPMTKFINILRPADHSLDNTITMQLSDIHEVNEVYMLISVESLPEN